MNNKADDSNTIPDHQIQKFHDIITKLFQCCQERMPYQSDKFALPDSEWRCLMLFNHERYLTAKNIADKMNVVKIRISKIIEGLAEINAFQSFHCRELLCHMVPDQRKTMIANPELLKASNESMRELMV